MQRLFLPVGQGAFYCEKFSEEDFCGKVNVVYDCGTISGLSVLKSVIERTFEHGEVIDALFLSHLHEDHINGLPILAKRCNVKRVYLPMVDTTDLALMHLAYTLRRHPKPLPYENIEEEYTVAERFVLDALQNPVEAIRRYADAYVVALPVDRADDLLGDVHGVANDIFGERVGIGTSGRWIYMPFNIRNDEESDKVRRRFVGQFGKEPSSQNVAEVIADIGGNRVGKKALSEIRDMYKGIRDGLNANSMTLYSGLDNLGLAQAIDSSISEDARLKHGVPCSTAAGCLYTGDYIASKDRCYWKQLKTAYGRYWGNIGCVQIPHHGSGVNFNDEFLTMSAYNVISAGFGNMYHHPSNAVLTKYWVRHKFPFVVTQSQASGFSTVITTGK